MPRLAIKDVISNSTPTKPASKYNKCGHYSTHQTRDSSFGSKPFFEPLLVSPAQNLFGNYLLSDSYFRSSKLDQFLIAVLLKITQDCCSVMLLRLRRAHCEPLDHSPDRGDLRRIFCQVIVASISPPVPASLGLSTLAETCGNRTTKRLESAHRAKPEPSTNVIPIVLMFCSQP